MGRITRNSAGGSSSRIGSANSPANVIARMHLNNSTPKPKPKRSRVKKPRENVPDNRSEGCNSTPGLGQTFDFETEVPFEYSPRPNGFGTVLEFMKRGNESVKENILHECNIILECRVCNNLFRSPRDFITHKTSYCSEKYERISPAGITELLRLAQNSFKVNESASSAVSFLPPVVTNAVDNFHHEIGTDSELSFDVNHLVPMLKTVLHPCPPKEKHGVNFQPAEVKLETGVAAEYTNAGISRTTRQLPRGSNGELEILGKYKSQKSDKAAILGADGKAALVGKPSSIQLIVDRLTAQWESKLDESKPNPLKCHVCQTACPSEKSLRNHVRNEHQRVTDKDKRQNKRPIAFTKDITKILRRKKKRSCVIPAALKPRVVSQNKQKTVKTKSIAASSRKKVKSEVTPSVPSPPTVSPKPTNTAVIESKPKGTPPRVSSFRRLTNNSFSATLTTSSESGSILPSLSLQELGPPQKKTRQSKSKGKDVSPLPSPSLNGDHCLSEETPDYKAMAKALFVTDRKVRRNSKTKSMKTRRTKSTNGSPKKLSCLKCSAELDTEKEMSSHLGNCHGSQNSINKIGIIDRHDYLKGKSRDKLETAAVSTSLPFNNNENEVVSSQKVDCSKDTVQSLPQKSCETTETTSKTEPKEIDKEKPLDMNGELGV